MKTCLECKKDSVRFTRGYCIACYHKLRANNTLKKISVKSTPVTLTYEQEQVFIGTILGDAYIDIGNSKTKKTTMSILRSLKDKKYLEWQYNIFKDFIKKENISTYSRFDKRKNKEYHFCYFRTISSELWYKYREKFYINGIKIVPENINLDYLAIAVLICDDGCFYGKSTLGRLHLHIATNNFDKISLEILRKKISDKLDVEFKIMKHTGEKCTLHVSGQKAIDVYNKIKNYVPESMYRKFKHILQHIDNNDEFKIKCLKSSFYKDENNIVDHKRSIMNENFKAGKDIKRTAKEKFILFYNRILEIINGHNKFSSINFMELVNANINYNKKYVFVANYILYLVKNELAELTNKNNPIKIKGKGGAFEYQFTDKMRDLIKKYQENKCL